MATVESLGAAVAGVAPHSLRAVPAADLVELLAGVDATLGREAPLHIHISEQELEVEECLAARGRTPIDLLADTVELGPGGASYTRLTRRRRSVPGSVARGRGSSCVRSPKPTWGTGSFRPASIFSPAARRAAGSDANVRISAIEEARQLEYGQRLRDRRRARLATEAGAGPVVWSWLSQGGGEAVAGGSAPADGRRAPMRLGRIEPGYRADFVVLDQEGPTRWGTIGRPSWTRGTWRATSAT